MNMQHTYPMTWEEPVLWLSNHLDPQKRALAHACYFYETAIKAAKRFYESAEWDTIPDFVFKIRDHDDSAPGRLYSFRVTK